MPACTTATAPATPSTAPSQPIRSPRQAPTPAPTHPIPTASSMNEVSVAFTRRMLAPGVSSAAMRIGVIGGTGSEGFGLTLRLATAGHSVVIGSRSEERGAAAAVKANDRLGADAASTVEGTSNEAAASDCELVFVTVPFAGQAEIYRSIRTAIPAGRVVVDATSPLATAVGGRPWQVVRPWHGSAAEQAAAILGDGPSMVAAFHTIAAEGLGALDTPLDSDVFVCGDDGAAKATVGGIIEQVPDLRWVDAGALSMARIAETLTALLVSVNRGYEVRDSGFRVTGREEWGRPPR
jgi:8-hydroxy-5-deazaflavin:NADPH oxidoreductase